MNTKLKDIVIVVESGADFPSDLAKKYGVEIVPMHVIFDDVDECDGQFPVSKIIEYHHDTNKIPKTSAANVKDYHDLFEKIHQMYPDKKILHLCYSAVTTATFQNALIASEGLDYVYHLDTKYLSAGQTLIVLKACTYIKKYPDHELHQLITFVEEIISKTHMSFIPQQLDFLKAGGRVSNAAYLGANVLKLKPVIELIDGKLICTKKYRGSDYARLCLKLVREMTQIYGYDKKDVTLVYTVGLEDKKKKAIEHEIKLMGFENIYWLQAGGVITSHGGPNGFGFAFCEK